MKKRFYISLLFFCLFLFSSPICSFSQEAYQFVLMWPRLEQPWYFYRPSGVATDMSGNVFIADTFNNRIQKFDSHGNFVTKWGYYGAGNGQFYGPFGVAADSQGSIYVVDTWNNRIQKFDSNGNFITKWGTEGSENGQFTNPFGVATDASGNVYVADTANRRIQKFDSSGNFITKWGSYGTDNGQFHGPEGVAVDSWGSIYVVDTWNNRIQKFDSGGNFITKWGSEGSGNGQFIIPFGAAVDESGNVYVSDKGNNRIQKFDTNGTFIAKWGSEGSGDGQFMSPDGVAADASGTVYVADNWNNRMQIFDSNGNFIAKWGSASSEDGHFHNPVGVTIDPLGHVYVADSGNDRMQKFTSTGNFVAKWGGPGAGEGQFSLLRGVATGPSGDLFVADSGNDRIQKFDSSRKFIGQWGASFPPAIATDSSGYVYLADTIPSPGPHPPPPSWDILKFDSTGNLIAKLVRYSISYGVALSGIAIDAAGNIYVVDSGVTSGPTEPSPGVRKFDSKGDFIMKWGTQGTEIGQFSGPLGVAVDSSESVYVADTGNHRIQKFDSNGNFLTKWGHEGSAEGQFENPYGIAVDSSGNVYVVDSGNNRIQKFSPPSISLQLPPEGQFLNACSLYSPPTFSWTSPSILDVYEVQFSPDSGFSSVPVLAQVSTNQISIPAETWEKATMIPGALGGTIYWRVVGTKPDGTTETSEVRPLVVGPDPVENPTIFPTGKRSKPTLTWQTNCNTRFKFWFGNDSGFSNKTYSIAIENPTGADGTISKTLTLLQWMRIRLLVRNKTGSTLYWYVESWDGLGRYAKTAPMSFVLTD